MTLDWSPNPRTGLEFLTVVDPAMWKVCDTSVLLPFEEPGNGESAHFRIKFHGDVASLTRFAARRGFKGMNLTLLRRLARHAEVQMPQGVRQWNEVTLVDALVRRYLGGAATDAVVQSALKNRKETLNIDDVLTNTKLFDLEPEWVIDREGDDPELLKAYGELRARKAAAAPKAKQNEEALSAMQHARRASTASSGSGDGATPRGRTFVPVPCTGYTAEEAKRWAPPGCSISKETTRENRWRARAKFLPGAHEKTKSYGMNSSTDDFGAMRFLLDFCWVHYERISGQKCPFTFAELPARGSANGSKSSR